MCFIEKIWYNLIRGKQFIDFQYTHISISYLSELDLSSANTFVQQYIDEPFLIDDRLVSNKKLIHVQCSVKIHFFIHV